MNRRAFLKTTLTGAALTALPAGLRAEANGAGAPSRPNVVLVLTDDQGYGDLACHGNPVLKTMHLDNLHAQSVRPTDFHVSPLCAPTRAALMTGRHNLRSGVWSTIFGRSLLRRDETTMAQVFAANGYRTGMFGKWHLGDNFPYRPEDRGFHEVLRHGGGGVGERFFHCGLLADVPTTAFAWRPARCLEGLRSLPVNQLPGASSNCRWVRDEPAVNRIQATLECDSTESHGAFRDWCRHHEEHTWEHGASTFLKTMSPPTCMATTSSGSTCRCLTIRL
jgi:hypothetical protein